MQGMLKIKLFSLLIFPVLGACTTPQSADVSGKLAKLQLAQPSAVDNCSVGCPSGGSEVTLMGPPKFRAEQIGNVLMC